MRTTDEEVYSLNFLADQFNLYPMILCDGYMPVYSPKLGESIGQLNASYPAAFSSDALTVLEDGHDLVKPDAWIADVASGLSEAEARFTAISEAATNTGIVEYRAGAAAWRGRGDARRRARPVAIR